MQTLPSTPWASAEETVMKLQVLATRWHYDATEIYGALGRVWEGSLGGKGLRKT